MFTICTYSICMLMKRYAWFACAICWTRLCASDKHPYKYSTLVVWFLCPTHQNCSRNDSKKRLLQRSKWALWHSPSHLHNVTVWKQTIIHRTERESQRGEAAMIWDAVQSKEMREDIEGERGKKSSERYAPSHCWPSGNTEVSLCYGNMTVWCTWW